MHCSAHLSFRSKVWNAFAGPTNRQRAIRATAHRLIVARAQGNKAMEDIPIIPLRVLLGNPVYSSAKVSPDGHYISYLKPSADKDVLNVWVRPRTAAAEEEVMVTSDRHRGIRMYTWSQDSNNILFLQDKDGDEDWHLYAQALDGSPAREMTPFKGVRVGDMMTDHKFPEQVLLGLNRRDPRVFDIHRLHLNTGELHLDTENPGDVLSWYPDDNFVIRAALAMNPADGSKTLRVRDDADSAWRDVLTWSQDEEGRVVGFAKDDRSIYVTSSLGRDTAELQLISASSSPESVEVLSHLASSPKCDVGEVLVDPVSRQPLAAGLNYLRQGWQVLEPSLSADFEFLQGFKAGAADLSIDSRSTDNSVWLVSYVTDDGPASYYIYDRSKAATAGGEDAAAAGDPAAAAASTSEVQQQQQQQLQFLFVNRPELHDYKLGRRHPVLIAARDSLQLPSYLTLPPISAAPATLLLPDESSGHHPDDDDSPTSSSSPSSLSSSLTGLQLPLALLVHGGPWARDVWGLDATAQYMSNRGYAVLQVNYRGSTGFGKRFLHLGDKQWGVGDMQHDLTDAVQWAVRSGLADPARIAICGGSYGGYATLAGLCFTPDLYCCGVDIVGPSHIKTLLQSIPPYWAPMKRQLIDRIGDPEEDEELNRRISPLFHAQAISAPLLIAQGANDPRVKKAESDQIYSAMKSKGLEVQYYLYTDEGHGFARPPNRLDFYSRMDHFLAAHLGGRAEPPLKLDGTAVVEMHSLASLDDWMPQDARDARSDSASDNVTNRPLAASAGATSDPAGSAAGGDKATTSSGTQEVGEGEILPTAGTAGTDSRARSSAGSRDNAAAAKVAAAGAGVAAAAVGVVAAAVSKASGGGGRNASEGKAAAAGKGGTGAMGVGQKIGLAVGIPAAVLTGAAVLVVAVLRGSAQGGDDRGR